MKDKKILILIIFAGVVGFIFFVVSKPVEKNERDYHAAITQEVNIAQLESQVQQLRGLITAFVGLNRSLNASFQEEKRQRDALQQALAEASLQNESLSKELNQAKVSLELTFPIKQRIDKIESSLASAQAAPGKEKELKQKLQDINRELQLIDAQIPSLIKENTSYKRLSETLNGLLEKQEKDIAALRSAVEEERGQRQAVKKEFDSLKITERKSADLEKIRNNLIAANASLNTEINRLTKELKDVQIKLSQAAREKETAERAKDEAISRLHQERLRSTRDIEETKTVKQNSQKLQEQLYQLQVQLAQFQKDSASLQNEYAAGQEALKRNEATLGSRADKILALEENLADVQMKLTGIQSQYNDLEKESANLREQNVAVQLEREELKEQLNQSRIKLSGLENQLSQIGIILRQAQDTSSKDTEQSRSVLKTPRPAETTLPKEEAKRVEVELYPAEAASTEEAK